MLKLVHLRQLNWMSDTNPCGLDINLLMLYSICLSCCSQRGIFFFLYVFFFGGGAIFERNAEFTLFNLSFHDMPCDGMLPVWFIIEKPFIVSSSTGNSAPLTCFVNPASTC